jgi:phenylacetate-CoA ligase
MPTSAPSDAAIWDAAETMARCELEELQLRRLRETTARVVRADGLGARRLSEAGIAVPADVGSLDDIRRIPFMTKGDLRDQYPFGLLAVAREQLVRIHASSGTHGKPTVVGYTRADL